MACLIASLIRYAIQARMTTEDPADNFRPDTGRLQVWTLLMASLVGHGPLLIASLIRPTAGLAAADGLPHQADCRSGGRPMASECV